MRGIRERYEAQGHEVWFVSAKTKEGLEELRSRLYDRVKELHIKRYPYNHFLY
jgi:GTP-binding protein HflX